MGIISGGGGGGTFNGGTITNPLIISPSNKDAVALTIKPVAGATADGTSGIEVWDDTGSVLGYQAVDGSMGWKTKTAFTNFDLSSATHQWVGAGVGSGGLSMRLRAKSGGSLDIRDDTGTTAILIDTTGPVTVGATGNALAFYGAGPVGKPTVAGAKLPSDVVLASLLTALVALGLVTDNST